MHLLLNQHALLLNQHALLLNQHALLLLCVQGYYRLRKDTVK